MSALAIAIIVVLLNHALANTREKEKERRAAGNGVIEAFRSELDALNQTNDDCMHILTENVYLRHEAVIRNYLPLLSWIDRLRIHSAWRRLAYHKQDRKGISRFTNSMQIMDH